MKDHGFNENLEKAFREKLNEQILIEGQLIMSGKAVKIEKIGWLSATLQPGSFDLNQLLVQNGANVQFAGTIEIYPKGEGDVIEPTEIYNFEVIGIRVTFNSEKRAFEFESEITLSNLNKR